VVTKLLPLHQLEAGYEPRLLEGSSRGIAVFLFFSFHCLSKGRAAEAGVLEASGMKEVEQYCQLTVVVEVAEEGAPEELK
jgi:hypothetical protein